MISVKFWPSISKFSKLAPMLGKMKFFSLLLVIAVFFNQIEAQATLPSPQVLAQVIQKLRGFGWNSAADMVQNADLFAREMRIPEGTVLKSLGITDEVIQSGALKSDTFYIQELLPRLKRASQIDFLPKNKPLSITQSELVQKINFSRERFTYDPSVKNHLVSIEKQNRIHHVFDLIENLSIKNPAAAQRILSLDQNQFRDFLLLHPNHPAKTDFERLVSQLDSIGPNANAASGLLVDSYFERAFSGFYSRKSLEVALRAFAPDSSVLTRFVSETPNTQILNLHLEGINLPNQTTRVVVFGDEGWLQFSKLFVHGDSQILFQVFSDLEKSDLLFAGKSFGKWINAKPSDIARTKSVAFLPIPVDAQAFSQIRSRLKASETLDVIPSLEIDVALTSATPWAMMQTSDLWAKQLSMNANHLIKKALGLNQNILFVYSHTPIQSADEVLQLLKSNPPKSLLPKPSASLSASAHGTFDDGLLVQLQTYNKGAFRNSILMDPESALEILPFRNLQIEEALPISRNTTFDTRLNLNLEPDQFVILDHKVDSRGGPVLMVRKDPQHERLFSFYANKNGFGGAEFPFEWTADRALKFNSDQLQVYVFVDSEKKSARIVALSNIDGNHGMEIIDQPISGNSTEYPQFFFLPNGNEKPNLGVWTAEGTGFVFLPKGVPAPATRVQAIATEFFQTEKLLDTLDGMHSDAQAILSQAQQKTAHTFDFVPAKDLLTDPSLKKAVNDFSNNYNDLMRKLQNSELSNSLVHSAPTPFENFDKSKSLGLWLSEVSDWTERAKNSLQ